MKISVAPIPYFWNKDKVVAFYDRLQDLPVDIVYLGETVCSKRRELKLADWLVIAEQLTVAGKEVVLSTLALLEAESELSNLKKITTNGTYLVEANDVAAIHLLAGHGQFVLGAHINTYNNETLEFLHDMGAGRWVVPVELGRETVAQLQANCPSELETELFIYGRLPLAFSARCFTARAQNRPKDECDFICMDFPDGLNLETQDGDSFLVLNGIQIQSASAQNLIAYLDEISTLGIDIVRITPQAQGMPEIISTVRDVLDGRLQAKEANEQLAQYQVCDSCDGYWIDQAGMSLSREVI
jgi:collagenase-like PrtC family protease